MSEAVRVTDMIGVVGIDASDYDDVEHVTTVDVENLQRTLTLLEELGWGSVDIGAVEGEDDYPLLVIQPPRDALFGDDQAALTVAPLTEQGRAKRVTEGSDT